MKALSTVGLLLIGSSLLLVGLRGQFSGRPFLNIGVPSAEDNDRLLHAWLISNGGLLALGLGLLLMRSGPAVNLIWRTLGWGCVVGGSVSVLVGYPYFVMAGLANLGNDSRSWHQVSANLPLVFLHSQEGGLLLGLTIGACSWWFAKRTKTPVQGRSPR